MSERERQELEKLNSYLYSVSSLKLNEPTKYAYFYFDDSYYFSRFPTEHFANIIEEIKAIKEKEIVKKEVEKKIIGIIKEYIAACSLLRGKPLSEKELEEIVKPLTKKNYKTTLKIARELAKEFMKEKRTEISPKRFFFISLAREKGKSSFGYTYENFLILKSVLQNYSSSLEQAFNSAMAGHSLLYLPSVEKIISGKELTKRERKNNEKYITTVIQLIRKNPTIFSMAKNIIEEEAKRKGLIPKFEEIKLGDWDKYMLNAFIEKGKSILDGNWDLEEINEFLYLDKIRRGGVFILNQFKLLSYTSEKKVTFKDIVGSQYKKNVEIIKRSLKKMENREPLGYVMVLQGPPGNGKTYTMTATLNELPENARGIIFDVPHEGAFGDILTNFNEITLLHPEIYVVGMLDDMDLYVKKRGEERSKEEEIIVSEFLKLDSIVPRKLPSNCLIITSTNRLYVIDEAITDRAGRIQYVINFPQPGVEEMKELVEYYSKKFDVEVSPSVLEKLKKTEGMSCDDIRYIFQEAKDRGLKKLNENEANDILDQIYERKRLVGEALRQYEGKFYT